MLGVRIQRGEKRSQSERGCLQRKGVCVVTAGLDLHSKPPEVSLPAPSQEWGPLGGVCLIQEHLRSRAPSPHGPSLTWTTREKVKLTHF